MEGFAGSGTTGSDTKIGQTVGSARCPRVEALVGSRHSGEYQLSLPDLVQADLQNLLSKNWGEATKQKQVIEQRQRDLAAKRKADNEE